MDETAYCSIEPDFDVGRDKRADVLSFDGGFFAFDGTEPLASSGNKLVYPGTYTETAGKAPCVLPAVAVYFLSAEAHARELSNLKVAALLGVGPKLLATGYAYPLPARDTPECRPVLVEENAGTSLKDALDGKPIPWLVPMAAGGARAGNAAGARRAVPLEPADTETGRKQTAKLLFDLFSQVRNLQMAGKCHRDLKAANVCVKACGDHPWDVRATLVDLEFGTTAHGDGARVASERYHRVLFEQAAGRAGRIIVHPTPLQQDMGYLTLVVAEIDNRAGVRDLPEEAIAAALDKEDGFFGYESDGSVYARKVAATDLERQARRAGLVPVDALLAVSPRAVQIARQATKHGGYLDALDMKRLERNADMLLEKENDRIARQIFANYQAHRVRDGKPVEYRTFDEQPEDLKESCRDQARQMRDKLESLDFDIVAWDECPEELRVKALSARQVEHLAEREHERWVEERTRAGWTYAPGDKDVDAKTSPYLVPWDELDEDIKEYDRDPVRETIGVLQDAGFAASRRA